MVICWNSPLPVILSDLALVELPQKYFSQVMSRRRRFSRAYHTVGR